MSYTFLLGSEEVSSAESFSDIPPSVLLRLNLTAEKCYSAASATESCQSFRYGTTFAHSMESRGEIELTLLPEVSHAKTSVLPPAPTPKESTGSGVDSGEKWRVSFAKFDRDLSLWKIPLALFDGELGEFWETWPAWGMMRDGECSELTMSMLPTCATDAISWPTPTVCGNHNKKGATKTSGDGLSTRVKKIMWATPCATDTPNRLPSKTPHITRNGTIRHIGKSGKQSQIRLSQDVKHRLGRGGILNMDWVDWLMGWPIKWSAQEPLATDKFQQWLSSHGKR